MLAPSLIFAFVVSTLLGALAHLLVGGDARRLASLLIAAWLGFALGQALGTLFGIRALSIGALHMAAALSGSLAALTVTIVLTLRRPRARASG